MPARNKLVRIAALMCLAWRGAAAAPLNVVTTTSDIKSLVESVGGARVKVSAVAPGTQDPHVIETRPSTMVQLRNADLLVAVGLELEVGWLPRVIEGSRNTKVMPGKPGHLDLSPSIVVLEKATGTVDRSMGDVHPFGNPHYWLDPYNARLMAAAIATRLGELDRAGAPDYRNGAAAFTRALDERMFGAEAVRALGGDALWAAARKGKAGDAVTTAAKAKGATVPHGGGWSARLAGCAGKPIITFHRDWVYFLNRFGLVPVGELEARPGIPPSPGHLVTLVGTARDQHVRVVLGHAYQDRKAMDFVAGKAGASVVLLPGSVGGDPKAADYLSLMDLLVNELAGQLGCG